MPIPLEAQAQVYWLTCRDLRRARESGDGKAEAEALFELLDLGAYTQVPRMRRLCGARVPIGLTGTRFAAAKKKTP